MRLSSRVGASEGGEKSFSCKMIRPYSAIDCPLECVTRRNSKKV